MKIEEVAGVGKIVKGVNTTPDVQPGETERQAKKLFPMNKSGKPKQLKASHTHKAFNLGLVEDELTTIQRAELFAQQAHKDHKRKYTGDPYYVHLDEVRNIVKGAGGSEDMQAAALLHDTVEDTSVTSADIMKEFGPSIAKLVVELTDISKPEDGNRATRKAMDRDKLAGASAEAQTIKYADLISNGKDIMQNDPKFAKVYMKEKADLLRVMKKGNSNLRSAALAMLPDELKENISVTGTERRRLEKKKGIEIGSPEWFEHWFDLPYLRDDVQLNENPIIANIIRALANKGYKVAKDVVTAWYKNAPPGLTPEQAADAVIKTGIGVGGAVQAMNKNKQQDKVPVEESKRIPRKKGQKANSKKHSDLYTDENPKGTIQGLKFATVKDAEASVSRIKSSGRKHAHKIQAAIAMEQRAKAAGKKSAAAVYRRYINAMKKKTKKMNENSIQKVDIAQLEKFADRLFGKVGIDVEFTKHFMDRVNDIRNQKPITMSELTRLFKQEYKRWGKPIAQMGPDSQAVMKDLQTDINLPFVLKWDEENNELDLIAKTVMRKADFKTPNKEFPVEGEDVAPHLVPKPKPYKVREMSANPFKKPDINNPPKFANDDEKRDWYVRNQFYHPFLNQYGKIGSQTNNKIDPGFKKALDAQRKKMAGKIDPKTGQLYQDPRMKRGLYPNPQDFYQRSSNWMYKAGRGLSRLIKGDPDYDPYDQRDAEVKRSTLPFDQKYKSHIPQGTQSSINVPLDDRDAAKMRAEIGKKYGLTGDQVMYYAMKDSPLPSEQMKKDKENKSLYTYKPFGDRGYPTDAQVLAYRKDRPPVLSWNSGGNASDAYQRYNQLRTSEFDYMLDELDENVPNTNKPGTIGQYINWAGKNAPDKPKSNVTIARRKQPDPQSWWQNVIQKGRNLFDDEQLDLKKKFEITDELKQLDSIFKKGKHEIRIVGGAVRDLALGKSPKDIDLATDATPQEMQRMFDSAGVKHIPTGIEHGTVTAVLNGEPYEITTLRADVETDGRRAEVEFVRSWEEDAKRRDLTYNAMSMDFEGNLYDYHGGMDDLQDKVTKFVGDPEERIKEDYLRTLRYFRFQGRLDTPTFDRATMQAIANNTDGLKQLSVERVWMEMGKILGGGNIKQILNAMDKAGVLSAISLKYTPNNDLMDGGDPIINLARITDDETIGLRWKMSNEEKSKLGFLIQNKGKTHSKDWYTNMMVDGFDRTQLDALARYNNQDDMINYIKTFKAPEFPVDGNDLIKMGHERGPKIGQTLTALRAQWKAGNFSASKEELLQSMKESKGYFTRTKSQSSKGKSLLRTVKPDLEKVLKGIQHKLEPDSSGNRIIITVDKSDVDRVKQLVGLPNLTKVVSEEGPFGVLARKAGHAIFKSQYQKAAEFLHKILKRKYQETNGNLRHSLGYYAMMLARQTGEKLNWRELEQEYLNMYGNAMFENLEEAPKDWGDMKLDSDKLQQSLDYFYTDHAPNQIGNRREEGNFKGLKIVSFTKGNDTLMFLVNNQDQAVFYVAYSKFKEGIAVGNVRSNGTVRATEVYKMLVDKFGTLYSDAHQTPQGRKIWTDLARFFPDLTVKDAGDRLVATQKIGENFADGKKPGRKGLSKRVGIPKGATIAQLEKIAKNSTGERRRMAQWQLNMRRGKNKSKS